MSLRERIQSARLESDTRSSIFIFPYLAVLILVNVYASVALSPHDTIYYRFYYFWHSHGEWTGLLTWIMAVNSLVVVYLWVEFRSYRHGPRRNRLAPYLYFVCCALFLMLFQYFYLQVSLIDPGGRALIYDLRTPVAMPYPVEIPLEERLQSPPCPRPDCPTSGNSDRP